MFQQVIRLYVPNSISCLSSPGLGPPIWRSFLLPGIRMERLFLWGDGLDKCFSDDFAGQLLQSPEPIIVILPESFGIANLDASPNPGRNWGRLHVVNRTPSPSRPCPGPGSALGHLGADVVGVSLPAVKLVKGVVKIRVLLVVNSIIGIHRILAGDIS